MSPFIRLCDSYIDHPKFLALSAGAFRLWHEGIAFCRKHQTDGLIDGSALLGFRYYKPQFLAELKVALWETAPSGYQIHDYLDWNLSKQAENEQKLLSKHRNAFLTDKGLRHALRARDGDLCRYCGVEVNWADRKGRTGATYDHVDPRGAATMENLVIACRGCNSSKRGRTPEQAGFVLRNPPRHQEQNLDRNLDSTGLDRISSFVRSSERERERKPPIQIAPVPDQALAARAAALLDTYETLYTKHRHGAKLLTRRRLDFDDALELCAAWDDERLTKLADIFLTTDDEWISSTDRSFQLFRKKATWADDRLAAWEADRRKATR